MRRSYDGDPARGGPRCTLLTKDRPKYVARAAGVGHGHNPQDVRGWHVLSAKLLDLFAVLGAAANGIREDRRIGCDSDDMGCLGLVGSACRW